ncbi:hypothetical protein MNBD_GAMMA23-1044 [hydrothermal vent metagenome]|uniref:FHA domain-containing protein n=1 Tax=hydrothermal vent metagenome TaxID=652676 RepID=A0A3B0ZDP3_9ZZZZ
MAVLIQYANGVPGVKFSLDSEEISIGRALDNDISVDDEFVSKKHAVIQLMHDELTDRVDCILIDNDSTNHIYVNSSKVSAHRLEENDRIHIGQNEFRFSFDSVSHLDAAIIPHFESDEAPGLMHARAQAKTERLAKEHAETKSTVGGVPLDGYKVEDLADTKHQIGTLLDSASDDEENPAENGKRFSRRLTFI